MLIAPDFGAFCHLVVALAIGLLIGLERGWSGRTAQPGSRVAGVRTFGLLGLLGGAAALLYQAGVSSLATVLVAGAALTLSIGFAGDILRNGSVSATTAVAAILTLTLGAMVILGHVQLAAAIAVCATLLLALREDLHGWIASLSLPELKATLRFLALAVVIVPLLPDRALGPYGALNPFALGLVVVMLSGLSFAGYWSMRYLGPRRGLLVTAAMGGLASSTAVAFSMSRLSLKRADHDKLFAGGIVLASVVMLVRVLVLTALLTHSVFPGLVFIVGASIAIGCAVVAVLLRQSDDLLPGNAPTIANPFELTPALGFTVLLAAILVATHWARYQQGDASILLVGAFTGIVDVDAAIVAVGQLLDGGLSYPIGAATILIAVLVNLVAKALIPFVLGARGVAIYVALGVALMLCGSGAVYWVLR